jgi:hypothetical protein
MGTNNALIVWGISALVAGFGAYFGAYFKKKGENLATHEDLDKLIVELRATTEATKSIEARISQDLWVSQKGWELKRDILMQWFRSVHEANEMARETFNWIDKLHHNPSSWESQVEGRRDMLNAWQKCHMSVRSLVMDVRTVAGTELTDIAYSIGIQLLVIDSQLVDLAPTVTVLKTAALTIADARGMIKQSLRDGLILMRRELGISVLPSTPQSSEPSVTPTPDS